MSIPDHGCPIVGSCRPAGGQGGLTLIELVMFIMIVSIALAGVLAVMNMTTTHGADPMIRKQELATAASLLEEIESKPFTYCDPDDPNAATATSSAGCTIPEVMGPEPGEQRCSSTQPFDNVNDYAGYTMASPPGILSALDCATPEPGLQGYSAAVAETADGTTVGVPNDDALRIDVTVTGPDGTAVTLTGYRFRYAPNAGP